MKIVEANYGPKPLGEAEAAIILNRILERSWPVDQIWFNWRQRRYLHPESTTMSVNFTLLGIASHFRIEFDSASQGLQLASQLSRDTEIADGEVTAFAAEIRSILERQDQPKVRD